MKNIHYIYNQYKYRKSAANFSEKEVNTILEELNDTDAYELFLTTFGIGLEGQNKECLDRVINLAFYSYKEACNEKDFFDKDSIEAYAKVLFNAGVTFAMCCE